MSKELYIPRCHKLRISALQDNHELDLLLSFCWFESEPGEVWKEIPIYTDYYISNHGRVLSLKDNGYKLLKIQGSTKGYGIVDLSLPKSKQSKTKDKPKHMRVHQLVANAFLPNPENKPHIHHKDHNRRNNRVENLMWVTTAEHAQIHQQDRQKEKEAKEKE